MHDAESQPSSPRLLPMVSEEALLAATRSVVTTISILDSHRNATRTMEYLVAVVGGDGKMTAVKHRYSDFVALHQQLVDSLGTRLPPLPPSPTPRLKGPNYAALHEERKKQLASYLREAYAAPPEPPAALLEFLGLRPAAREGARPTASAAWGAARDDFLMAMLADDDEAARLGSSAAALSAALRSEEHALGALRRSLRHLLDARLPHASGASEWAAELRAMLEVLSACAVDACRVPPDRPPPLLHPCEIHECVERATFEEGEGAEAAVEGADQPRGSTLFYHAFAAISAQHFEKDQTFRARQHEWATLGSRSRRRLDRGGVTGRGAGGAQARARAAIGAVRAATTPSAKLAHIGEAVDAVSSDLAGADDLLQSLISALLTSDIKAPHAEVGFVVEFTQGLNKAGHHGYALATFQAAAEAISSLEIDVLLSAGDIDGEGELSSANTEAKEGGQ
ncbi:hypothetical protein AB1Y20_003776 [Prymnesium parvum]|uniref:PX domain-containing protein n=1 Tax=Prymnesium parvum TaxID=97485 RepID=A0AB34J4U0_PRYPA